MSNYSLNEIQSSFKAKSTIIRIEDGSLMTINNVAREFNNFSARMLHRSTKHESGEESITVRVGGLGINNAWIPDINSSYAIVLSTRFV